MSKFYDTVIYLNDRKRWSDQGAAAMGAAFPDAAEDDETATDTILAVLHRLHARGYKSEGIAQVIDIVTSHARAERILDEA